MSYQNSEDKRLIIEAFIIGFVEISFIVIMAIKIYHKSKEL